MDGMVSRLPGPRDREHGSSLAGVFRKATFWESHADKNLNDRQRLMLNKLLDGFDGKLTSFVMLSELEWSRDSLVR